MIPRTKIFKTVKNIAISYTNKLIKTSLVIALIYIGIQPSFAIFDPILIDDDDNHKIWKIVGANSIDDLVGAKLNTNDGIGPKLQQVGSYPLEYNVQDLALDNNGKTWALAAGPGQNATYRHAYIGNIEKISGEYTLTNIVDLGPTYRLSDDSWNQGKALVWDPDNNYFIYEANPFTRSQGAKQTVLKAYDPISKSVVIDPWGTGSDKITINLPIAPSYIYTQALAFSPDGQLYASVGNDPAIIVKLERNANHKLTGNSTLVGSTGLGIGLENIEALFFAPSGDFYAIESNGGDKTTRSRIYKVDLTTGEPTEIVYLDDSIHDPSKGYRDGARDWEGVQFYTPVYAGKKGCPAESKKNTLWYTDYSNNNNSGIFTIEAGSTGGKRTYTSNDFYGDIAVAADGYIYTASMNSGNIIKFSKNGERNLGSIGKLSVGLSPNGLAFDENGYLYVGYSMGKYYQVKDINDFSSYSEWFDPRDFFSGNYVGSSGDIIFVGGKAYVSINDNNWINYLIELTVSNNNIVTSSRIVGKLPDASYGLSTDGFGRVFVASERTVKQLDISSNKSSYGQNYTIPTQIIATDTVASGDMGGLSSVNESLGNAGCGDAHTTLTIKANIINDDSGSASIEDMSLKVSSFNLVFNNDTNSDDTKRYTANTLDIHAGNHELEAGEYTGYSLTGWSCTGNSQLSVIHHNSPLNTQTTINVAKGDHVTCTVTYDDKPAEVNKCFAMTDNVTKLYKFDLDINTPPVVVDTTKALNGEAATYRATDNSIYTFHQDLESQSESKPSDLYKISMEGTVSLVKKEFLPKKANGAEFIRYSDGTERFITIQNKYHSTLSVFDATDLTNATPLKTIKLIFPDGGDAHVDGLAVNPLTGEILVSDDYELNNPTDRAEIYSVNMETGLLSLVTTLAIVGVDAEALAFAEDGNLYTETEWEAQDSIYRKKIFQVDLSTGKLVGVEDLSSFHGDIEGMSCTGSKVITTTLPSFTKEATPDTTIAGSTVHFTYKINNTTNATLELDLKDDLKIVNDFSGTAVNEALTPINAIFMPASLRLGGSPFQTAKVIDNNILEIKQLSIPPNTSAQIKIDIRVPSSHEANDYFTQAVISNLTYKGSVVVGGSQSINTHVYSDDPNRTGFPDPTLIKVTEGTDKGGCDALTDNINAGLSPVSNLKNNDKIFLGSTNLTNKEGHLKAFSVNAAGAPTGNALWDAASLMDATKRSTKLYASNANSLKSTLSGSSSSLTSNDFGGASANMITTLTTSIYNAKLASLSPGSNLALITNEMDTLSYLDNPYYRSHYTNTIASRVKRVLLSSDDGFLYAFDQDDGELGWGWMPHSLLRELKDGATTFKSEHYMQGVVEVIDIKDSTTSYKSYVVGSYRQGLGHYVLRLSDDEHSNLDDAVWEQDLSSLKSSSPNNGKPAYFKDGNDTAYLAYIASSDNSSVLYIRSIKNNAITYAIPLSFDSGVNATSTPYIMAALDGSNNKTIFLGDKNGNIYSTDLLNSGILKSTSAIANGLNTAVTSLNTATSKPDPDPVLFIGGARSSKNNGYYLRAQSATRLTVFKYVSGIWERQWTSSGSSATRWKKVSGNIVVDSTDNSVIAIPTGASITDNAFIVADSIVLPVMHLRTGNNCDGDSYYYFYNLTDGHFPTDTFYSGTTALSAELELGVGKTRALHLTNLLGSDNMLGLGMSDQTNVNGTKGIGINASITIKDPFTTGIRSWRELRD